MSTLTAETRYSFSPQAWFRLSPHQRVPSEHTAQPAGRRGWRGGGEGRERAGRGEGGGWTAGNCIRVTEPDRGAPQGANHAALPSRPARGS